jgi:hypothetical protein
MKKAEEYRAHAEECRQLAARGDARARDQLLKMAETWESLAMAHETNLARQERIKALEAEAPSLGDQPKKRPLALQKLSAASLAIRDANYLPLQLDGIFSCSIGVLAAVASARLLLLAKGEAGIYVAVYIATRGRRHAFLIRSIGAVARNAPAPALDAVRIITSGSLWAKSRAGSDDSSRKYCECGFIHIGLLMPCRTNSLASGRFLK